MEITEINNRCQQIARTIGPRASIVVVIDTAGMRPCNALIHEKPFDHGHYVHAETWEALFAAIERETRPLALKANAADIEYESWTQPALMLAAE
jgi:hypothetical protein